jgi:vacuolar-type H+-ATPase subunit D/Vma8
MKSKLKGAQTGHDLLKRKSEALTKYASAATPIVVKLC